MNSRGKIPCVCSEQREQGTIWGSARAFFSSKQGLPSEETVSPEHRLLGFYQILGEGGKDSTPSSLPHRRRDKGDYPLQPQPSVPRVCVGEGALRNLVALVKFTV